MNSSRLADEIAAAAARLVVDEGLDYAGAKRRALKNLGLDGRGGARSAELPGNDQVEDAVREHLALFNADTQPGELRALRELALQWMQRLAEFRPHLSGAVWRGTATRLSPLLLDLYCDDGKAAEIELINLGLDFEPGGTETGGHRRNSYDVLSVALRSRELGGHVTLHLLVHDLDDLRGALKPDGRGRTWRGDASALRRLLAAEDAAATEAPGP